MTALPKGLRLLTRLVRLLTGIGALVLCAVPLMFWLTPDRVKSQGPVITSLGHHPVVIDDRALLLGALGSLPAIGLGLFALWNLWQLFGETGQGRVLGATAQRHLHRFAWGMLVAALLAPLQRAWVGLVLTVGNPPGQRLLAIGLSWNDYVAILCGAVLLAIATVMAEAVRLASRPDGDGPSSP